MYKLFLFYGFIICTLTITINIAKPNSNILKFVKMDNENCIN